MPPRTPIRLPRLRQRAHSTLTLPPPLSGTALLSATRRLVSVHGPDAARFLQGLTTIDIPPLTAGGYAAFLTPQVRSSDSSTHRNPALTYSLQKQGRVLFDVFVYPANRSPAWRAALTPAEPGPDDPGFFIECDAASAPRLLQLLARYKLRSKFTARPAPHWSAWAVWGAPAAAEISGPDNRAPGFGTRVLLPDSAAPDPALPRCDPTTYRLRRILHGIPEGQHELIEGVALPAESCIDYMRGVDFHKGCYVGQELTVRTHHRGVVRKRILPVQLYSRGAAPPQTLQYTPQTHQQALQAPAELRTVGAPGRPAGRWLGGVGNVGLALWRLENALPTEVSIGKGDDAVRVRAFVPEWHVARAAERERERGGEVT